MIEVKECPLCNSGKLVVSSGTLNVTKHPLWIEGLAETIEWRECEGCGHEFTRYVRSPEEDELLFSKTNVHQSIIENPEVMRRLWEPCVRMLEDCLPGYIQPWCTLDYKARWLDIGVGNGALLMVAHERGFNAGGIDIRPEVGLSLEKNGFDASYRVDDFMSMRLEDMAGQYAVVSMCDMIEHVRYPASALERAGYLLKEDGLLLVSFPNTESLTWKVLEANGQNPYRYELEHYHNFSMRRMVDLLAECGFELVEWRFSQRYLAGVDVVARRMKR